MKSGPVPIHTVVRPVESWNPLRAGPDESFPYIDLGSVDQERKVITEAKETRCGDAPSRARQLVKAGDILVSTVRPNLNGVAQISSDLDGATASTGFCVLRPETGKVSPRYLMQWVKSPAFIGDMVRKATGASYPAVSDRIIGESLIPLPSLDEQRRIADILDRADALRAKRRAAIARLDELTQAIFVEMFGDPVSNPKGWSTRTFEEAIEDHTAKAEKIQQSDYLTEGRFPIIDQGQKRIAGYTNDNGSLCPSGLPVIVFGDHTRAVKLIRFPFCVGADGAKVLVPSAGMNAGFLAWALRLLHIPNLGYSRHMREVKRLRFIAPPLHIQNSFDSILLHIDQVKATKSRSMDELDSLFASLQSRAFQCAL